MTIEYCVDAEYIPRKPLTRMKPPRVAVLRDRVLSLEEDKAILE